jgi:hypothetical protein
MYKDPQMKKLADSRYYKKNKSTLDSRNLKRYQLYRSLWREWFHKKGLDYCTSCGYKKSFAAIEFHHESPDEKDFQVSQVVHWAPTDRNKEKCLSEIGKTQRLCSNCHKELHWGIN